MKGRIVQALCYGIRLQSDTSAYNAVFWAALAGGTPNVITVVDTGFNATDGSVINFTALAPIRRPLRSIRPGMALSRFEKDTTAGPVSLTGGEIIQNNVISVVYRSSDNAFHLLNPPIQSVSGTTAPRCGMTGLKIINDGSTPNSIMDLTATTVVLSSASGLTINRSNVSVTVNISLGTVTSAVGGMDGEVPGTSAWLYLFLIDNGSGSGAVASLAAGNGLTPNLPSGYTYKCYAGAIRVYSDGTLLRTLQAGIKTQYVVTTATNTPNLPQAANGVAGTYSATAPTYATIALASYMPPTATQVSVVFGTLTGVGSEHAIIAPNTSYSGITSTNPPVGFINTTTVFALPGIMTMVVENYGAGPTIAWTSDGAHIQVNVLGWIDGQVNAN